MKKLVSFSIFMLLVPFTTATSIAERVPLEIAGLRLGGDISSCAKLVRMDTALPIRHQEYLYEVEVIDVEGYKSGLVAFGDCADPRRIIRIKMKYAYSDKKFFNELLERFKKRFGEPDEWRGDPFQAIIAWKWSFNDAQDNKISIRRASCRRPRPCFGRRSRSMPIRSCS